MKRTKRIMALLLAGVIMVLTTFPPLAIATEQEYMATADGSFSITIKAKAGDNGTHAYDAYQIFAGDLAQTEGSNATYNNIDGTTGSSTATGKKLSNILWGSAFGTPAATNATINDALLVSPLTDTGHIFAEIQTKVASGAYVPTARDFAEALEDALTNSTNGKADVQMFADLIASLATTKANSTTATSTGGSDATVTVTRPGYYLVKEAVTSNSDSTRPAAYSDFILQVLDNVEVTAKSAVPAVEKKVAEGDYTSNDKSAINANVDLGQSYNDVADYAIGDTVPFEVLGTIASNYADYNTVYYYKITDILDSGLSFVSTSSEVSVEYSNDNGTSWSSFESGKYTTTITGQTLTVEFPVVESGDSYTKKGLKDVSGISADSVIRVRYNAKLNKDAVVGLNGNVNTARLDYSNNPNAGGEGSTAQTLEDKAIVFTYELDVTKYGDEVADGNKKAGAGFIIKNSVGKVLAASSYTGGDVTAVTWIDAPAAPTSDTDKADPVAYYTTAGAKVLTTDANGKISVKGLEDQTYTVVEVKAPAGYNLAGPTTVAVSATTANGQAWNDYLASSALTAFAYTVTPDGGTAATVTQDGSTGKEIDGIAKADFVDLSGTALPSTGGIGTTIFYVVGGLLLSGSVVALVTKRRMGSEA